MTHPPRLPRTYVIVTLFSLLALACDSTTPTGVETDDLRGTWSGTFEEFSLLGRDLSGDGDWTFTRDTFEIIFFNPPEGQAERIEGDWKFADEKIALKLKSSFPIDTDIGATDTLFVSILRDEMSLKTIAESSILLVKTRLALKAQEQTLTSRLRVAPDQHTHFPSVSGVYPERSRGMAYCLWLSPSVLHDEAFPGSRLALADIRIASILQHPPA